ncbi:hypothetical protein QAD02_005855 [Eretmocerus hayati]|uniref:Uncharacterized protein n=1 Tax=Eretmocerus hayati TaxID=131215 RepID=A0ACC2NUP9_9HYME|nr:hypothetical protein QAD02_005855 [Eretmocerus hayati]
MFEFTARGRGRGFVEAPLRRPGQPLVTKFNDLINLIDNLDIEDLSCQSKVDHLVQNINDSIKNNSLEEVFDDFHKRALEDRLFGTKLAIALCDRRVQSLDSFRKIMLQTLQKDFEEREEIKKKNVLHFRNAISLLGEVCNTYKINGKPLGILEPALIQYFDLLLEDAEEEDVELVLSQILLNGKSASELCPTELSALMNKIRKVLMKRNLSAKSRGLLLFSIDLAHQNFQPISGTLLKFYTNELGVKTLADIQRLEGEFLKKKSINDAPNNSLQSGVKSRNDCPPNPQDRNVPLHGLRSANQNRPSGPTLHEKSPPSIGGDRPPVPRAIRGAGAGDAMKDKNTRVKLSNSHCKVCGSVFNNRNSSMKWNVWALHAP